MCSSGGEIAANDLALQETNLAMTKQLEQDYNISFAQQQAVLGGQLSKLNYIAANPLGYTPQELHSATTSINENTANAAKTAVGAAASYAAAHGGADIGGGPIAGAVGQIVAQAATGKAQSLADLTRQNQEMKRQNFWSAISGLNSVGAQYGGASGTAIGGAGSTANSAVGAGEGALKAKQAGWENFAGILSGITGLIGGGAKAYSDVENA